MRKFFSEDFSSKEKILEDIYENLSSAEGKEEYIDYFYKIEKLNRELRMEFYKSSIEMIKSMEIFFPEEEEIWKDERLAHKEVFRSPMDVFGEMHRQYSFYKLLRDMFTSSDSEKKEDIADLKKDYAGFVKKYIAVISARGFKEIYRNYIDILEKSNDMFEELMVPMTSVISKEDCIRIIENPAYMQMKKEDFEKSLRNLNNKSFEEFCSSSAVSQKEIVDKTEKFSETVIEYYDIILKKILMFIEEVHSSYSLIEKRLSTGDFEKYYIFMKKMTEKYIEDYMNSEEFRSIMSETESEMKLFINDDRQSEIDMLKDEIRILKEKIRSLEEKTEEKGL